MNKLLKRKNINVTDILVFFFLISFFLEFYESIILFISFHKSYFNIHKRICIKDATGRKQQPDKHNHNFQDLLIIVILGDVAYARTSTTRMPSHINELVVKRLNLLLAAYRIYKKPYGGELQIQS